MSEKMKAAYLVEKRRYEIREVDKPVPGDDEVLIRIRHVGICGADVEFFGDGAVGGWVLDEPVVSGHEPAGEIAGLGRNVTGFEIGDPVVVEPGEPCWKCDLCKKGLYNMCDDVVFYGVPGTDGAFREYVTATADMVFKLPQGVSTLTGALVEPLAVGFHAANQSGAKLGMSATILGSGCIGLMILLALRARGLREIYVVDTIERRLQKAKELGAAEVINVTDKDAVEAVNALTGGKGTDLVYEVTGSKQATLQTVGLVKKAGTITMIGLSSYADLPFDINGLICKEATIKTNFRYRNLYPVVLEALRAGQIDLEKVISDIFKFEDIQAALEHNTDNKPDVIKAVIEF